MLRCVALQVRGTALRTAQRVHIPGAGDFHLASMTALSDPVPLPETDPEARKAARRSHLSAKETLLYAPFANVGAVSTLWLAILHALHDLYNRWQVTYDSDAVYINMPHAHFTKPEHVSHFNDFRPMSSGITLSMCSYWAMAKRLAKRCILRPRLRPATVVIVTAQPMLATSLRKPTEMIIVMMRMTMKPGQLAPRWSLVAPMVLHSCAGFK